MKINQLKKLRNLLRRKNPRSFNKIEIIVSTNCLKVKNFCRKFKWIKIHERNKFLSNDASIQELIEVIPKICSGEYILWTHVTSPFFNEKNYYNFLNQYFRKSKKNNSAFSADLIQKFLFCKKRGWISHKEKEMRWPRTQDLNKIYIANSAAFIAPIKIYRKLKNRLCKSPIPILSENNLDGFDIDNLKDFVYLKKRLRLNGKA